MSEPKPRTRRVIAVILAAPITAAWLYLLYSVTAMATQWHPLFEWKGWAMDALGFAAVVAGFIAALGLPLTGAIRFVAVVAVVLFESYATGACMLAAGRLVPRIGPWFN